MMRFLKSSKTLKIVAYLVLVYFVEDYVSSRISSNPFLEFNNGQIPSISPNKQLSDPITGLAYSVCKNRILSYLETTEAQEFATDTYDIWNLTGGRYLIRSVIYTESDGNPPARRSYACRIQNLGRDNDDPGNWDVQSIDVQPA